MSCADKWTPEQDARIAALRAEGKTYRQIGEIIGKTEQSIISRVDRLKHRENGTTAQRATRARRKFRARHSDDGGEADLRMAIWRRQHKGARQALEQMGAT